MDESESQVTRAAGQIVEAARNRMKLGRPFLVAIDGGSGSGKSSVAAKAAASLDAVLVPGDDFFAAEITDDGWASRDAAERARDAVDWTRLRDQVLRPLLDGLPARWQAFDFVSGARSDGSYGMLADHKMLEPSNVIVLEGAYASRPELLDLIDLSVLVDVPVHVRHRRLLVREERSFLDV